MPKLACRSALGLPGQRSVVTGDFSSMSLFFPDLESTCDSLGLRAKAAWKLVIGVIDRPWGIGFIAVAVLSGGRGLRCGLHRNGARRRLAFVDYGFHRHEPQ